MAKWNLALISVGLLLIAFSETASENKMTMIAVGLAICAFGALSFFKGKKG